MSTLSRSAPRVKAGRAPLACELALTINGTAYRITPIRPEDPEIVRAWRLEKDDGTTYDVAEHFAHGHQCDCPDFEARRKGLDASGCKHIKAAVAVGLLDAAKPLAAPAAIPSPAPTHRPVRVASDGADRTLATLGWTEVLVDGRRYWEKPADAPACCAPSEAQPCAPCSTAADDARQADFRAAAEAHRPAAVDLAAEEIPGKGDAWEAPEEAPAEPDAWAEHDAFRWEPGPEPADPGPLDLASWIAHEARKYRGLGHEAGELLARTLDDLAAAVRFHEAATPDAYLAAVALARPAAEDLDRDDDAGDCPVD